MTRRASLSLDGRAALGSRREYPGWVSDRYCAGRHILSDHRPGAHDRSITERYALENQGTSTDEAASSNPDGFCAASAIIPPAPFTLGKMEIRIEYHGTGTKDRPLPHHDFLSRHDHSPAESNPGAKLEDGTGSESP